MNQQEQAISNGMDSIVDDARNLMNATADATGDKICDARRRLSAALENAKELAGRVRDQAVAGTKAADQAVREHPYQAIGISLGVGAVIGFLIARQCSRKD